jgi:hypothetical protein
LIPWPLGRLPVPLKRVQASHRLADAHHVAHLQVVERAGGRVHPRGGLVAGAAEDALSADGLLADKARKAHRFRQAVELLVEHRRGAVAADDRLPLNVSAFPAGRVHLGLPGLAEGRKSGRRGADRCRRVAAANLVGRVADAFALEGPGHGFEVAGPVGGHWVDRIVRFSYGRTDHRADEGDLFEWDVGVVDGASWRQVITLFTFNS